LLIVVVFVAVAVEANLSTFLLPYSPVGIVLLTQNQKTHLTINEKKGGDDLTAKNIHISCNNSMGGDHVNENLVIIGKQGSLLKNHI